MDERLERLVRAAVEDATAREHNTVSCEHLLSALTSDDEVTKMLAACGADPGELRRELAEYLDLLPQKKTRAPQFDRHLARVMARLIAAEMASPRDAVARIADEAESYAAMLYHAAGIEPIELFRYAAHGHTELTLEVPRSERLALVLHNDNFTTMEFVVAVLVGKVVLEQAEAERLMLEVHQKGSARVAVLRAARAVELARELLEIAGDSGFPLRVSLEAA
jgi:ATP-dependent Clp protease adaptor protein ClpS